MICCVLSKKDSTEPQSMSAHPKERPWPCNESGDWTCRHMFLIKIKCNWLIHTIFFFMKAPCVWLLEITTNTLLFPAETEEKTSPSSFVTPQIFHILSQLHDFEHAVSAARKHCFCSPGSFIWHTPTYSATFSILLFLLLLPKASLYVCSFFFFHQQQNLLPYLGNASLCEAEPASYYRRWKWLAILFSAPDC